MTNLPDIGTALAPVLAKTPVERQPLLVALAEKLAAARYRDWALAKGFLECVAGPLVRSSYRAERALERNNAGLAKQEAVS